MENILVLSDSLICSIYGKHYSNIPFMTFYASKKFHFKIALLVSVYKSDSISHRKHKFKYCLFKSNDHVSLLGNIMDFVFITDDLFVFLPALKTS